MSSPQGRRTGLIVVLILVPLLVLGALVAGGAYVLIGLRGSDVPAGWPTAAFVVTTTDHSTPSQETRENVGRLLMTRAGGGARYEVRPHGVRVGVPVAERASLARLRALSPISTDVEFRPVDEAGATEFRSWDGKMTYHLGAVGLTGKEVTSAKAEQPQTSTSWQVTLSLNSAGAAKFTALTTSLVGKQLAIVVAGAVVSAPAIQQPITGGNVQVGGTFTRDQAEGLAAAFQVGQRPVAVTLGDPG